MLTKPHIITALLRRRGDAHGVAAEGSTDFKHLPTKMNLPLLLDPAHRDPRVILNRRQRLGIGPQAGLIPLRRDRQLQGFMRAVVIIDLPPLILPVVVATLIAVILLVAYWESINKRLDPFAFLARQKFLHFLHSI